MHPSRIDRSAMASQLRDDRRLVRSRNLDEMEELRAARQQQLQGIAKLFFVMGIALTTLFMCVK